MSKAHQQTGVNLSVTFKMDVDKQAAPLRKKIEKLQWQIDNRVLSEDQIRPKREQTDTLKQQIQALGWQLPQLQVTKVVHRHTSEASITEAKGKAFPGLCTGKAIQ